MKTLSPGFEPQTGANVGGPGSEGISPGSCVEPGHIPSNEPVPMTHEARLAPWSHEPGRMSPWVPVRGRTVANGQVRPEPKPCFLLVPDHGICRGRSPSAKVSRPKSNCIY